MKTMNALAMILIPLLGLASAHAAITTNIECVDATGLKVYWESQLGIMDADGEFASEILYRNHVLVDYKKLHLEFVPDQAVTNGEPAILAAWQENGQFVKVSAIHLIKGKNGEPSYSGTMSLKVKTKKGWIKRPAHTPVRCSIGGEA